MIETDPLAVGSIHCSRSLVPAILCPLASNEILSGNNKLMLVSFPVFV